MKDSSDNVGSASHAVTAKMGKKPKVKAKLRREGPPLSEKTALKLSSQLAGFLNMDNIGNSVMADKSITTNIIPTPTPTPSHVVSVALDLASADNNPSTPGSDSEWETVDVQNLNVMADKSALTWADHVSLQESQMLNTHSQPYPGFWGGGRAWGRGACSGACRAHLTGGLVFVSSPSQRGGLHANQALELQVDLQGSQTTDSTQIVENAEITPTSLPPVQHLAEVPLIFLAYN